MKKFINLFLLTVALTGCTNTATQTTPTIPVEFTVMPTLAVDETPEVDDELPFYAPQFGDSELNKANAIPNSTALAYSASDPPEVLLFIKGHLPTPCHQFRATIPDPDEDGNIYVEIYSLTEPEIICEQVLRAFDVTINMGSYPRGSYWVYVNGGRVGNFDY